MVPLLPLKGALAAVRAGCKLWVRLGDPQGPVAPAWEALNNCFLCPFAAGMLHTHEVL